MTNKDGTDFESSLLVIKLDDTPCTATKSPSQKRSIESSPVSNTNSKQRRICVHNSYKSPLIHLGKTNRRKTRWASLDDSVIVLEELTSSPALDKPTLRTGEKKLPICADDSIIILSDNEEESKTETNVKQTELAIILEDDSSRRYSEPMEVTPVRKVTKRKPIRHRFPYHLCHRPNLEPKITTDTVKLPNKERSMSNLGCKSKIEELGYISIDSKDENTIPNDVSSRSNPQPEIIHIETNTDVSHFTMSKADIGGSTINDEISSPSTGLSSQPAITSGSISIKKQQARAKGLAQIRRLRKKAKRKKKFALQMDRKRISCDLNQTNTQHAKKEDQTHLAIQGLLNPEGAKVANNEFTKNSLVKEASETRNEPGANEIRTYYTEDLTHLTINRLLNPKLAKVAENESTKDLIVKEPSETINKPKVNGIQTYYTEEPIVKVPGSLREIVIDGCNIAMAYTNGKSFSETGLKLAIDYFRLRGHTVKVFVPQHVRSLQHKLLESLYTEGIVVFTPSRRIGNKKIVSYDDRYILDYATVCDGIVVSRDQYRDLYGEKREWRDVIEKRLLVPTFVGKCLMFPEDPLGRDGPRLETFLRH